MKIKNYRLGFIGFGHMGQILFKAIDDARLIPRSQMLFCRRDPTKAKRSEQELGVTSTTLPTLVEQSNVLLLCVRPQQAALALQDLSPLRIGGQQFISIMAGIKIAAIQKTLGVDVPIARAMPNIASSVGEGMSLLAFHPEATLEFKSMVELLFSSFGKAVAIAEEQMDLGCALAGSAPAFVIELIESMAKIGESRGLSYEKSLQIAAQVFAGAAHLIRQGAVPQEVIVQMATTAGTTAAGLEAMRKGEVCSHFRAAILAAELRSQEISEEFS